jgi:predicted DsbA family dithiol-disulfide isomerase
MARLLHAGGRPATLSGRGRSVVSGIRLILFADYVCPFSCLSERVADRLRRDGVHVEGAAFELRPPGTPLPHADAVWSAEEWARTIEPLAAAYGVPLRRPDRLTRTRKAHEAAAYARREGRYAEMHAALYAAWWEEGRDIGRIDVLTGIGRDVGLDASGLRVALDIDQCTARVESDEARAAELGMGGVPAYVMESGTGVAAGVRVGMQTYEELGAWVEHDDI